MTTERRHYGSTDVLLREHTHYDHVAHMSAAELRVRRILHVEDPAGDEDAQPGQEKVLHLDGWETTLWRVDGKKKRRDSQSYKHYYVTYYVV